MTEEKDDVGFLTIGAGTSKERKIKIVDGIVFDWADHRTVSIMKLDEDNGYTIALENAPHTGRTDNTWWLSEDSFIALIGSISIYASSKETLNADSIKKAVGFQDMRYYEYGDVKAFLDSNKE